MSSASLSAWTSVRTLAGTLAGTLARTLPIYAREAGRIVVSRNRVPRQDAMANRHNFTSSDG